MDRQHRNELKHDKFIDEIGSLSLKARDNQRLLYTVAGGAVALALIVYGIFFYRSNRETKAQDALAQAIETIDSPLKPATGEASPAAKFKTEEERRTAAEKQFTEVQKNFSGSDAADVAGLYLAQINAVKGNTAEARKQIEAFISDHPKAFLAGPAKYSLYQLRLENGEAQQVSTEVERELAKPEPELPADTLLIVLAHAYDVQGNGEKSLAAYRRIATEFPDSPYAIDAQRKIGTV